MQQGQHVRNGRGGRSYDWRSTRHFILRTFVGLICVLPSANTLWAFWDNVHKNLPEEAMLYMETQGTNQMRWATDYLKAKAGGRYVGTCANVNYSPSAMTQGDNTQCGSHGIQRVGGVKIDYLQDNFIDTLLFFGWNVPLMNQNITTYTHFINLKFINANGNLVRTDNYNLIDGFSYNASYGFDQFASSIDWLIATAFGNSSFTINIHGCTHANCAEYTNVALPLNTNPIVDYQQNGSTTPLGSPSTNKQLGNDDGTNYNCYSDGAVIAPCPDLGSKLGGTYQTPNVVPGGASNVMGFFTSDQDWVIWEPAYNAATFYYNEGWLEGAASKNHSLQTGPIANRYYTVSPDQQLYFGVVQHYAGDATQISHIWVTSGYNHSDYESFVEDNYGKRQIGGADPSRNYENYLNTQAYLASRQNRYNLPVGNIHKIIIEQAFQTYYIRYRAGYDKMTTTNRSVWQNAGMWAVQNATAEMSLITEKAVMDLRKCRNSAACDNN